MRGFSHLPVFVGVAWLFSGVQCDVSCKGTDGHPGEAGAPGRNGWPGVKGDKGDAGGSDVLLRIKGEKGSRGEQGDLGPKGYQGDLGSPGLPGKPGLPGPDGKRSDQDGDQSAFSVIRNITTYPSFSQVQSDVVNIPGHFKTSTGEFICNISGVYYFNFHSVAKVSVCLAIVSNTLENKLVFCDYSKGGEQVLSGGVVLQLTAGDKVWLESHRDLQGANVNADTQSKQIIFNGFLIFTAQ
uniref:Complement C1q subcomponent subunit A n=1 Tax=Oryzias latipes TaxID=8090 RepID=H2MYQ7_ORYLA